MTTPMDHFLRETRREASEVTSEPITWMVIEMDNAPMLPASFAQSVSYDPECACDYDASFREERWGGSFSSLYDDTPPLNPVHSSSTSSSPTNPSSSSPPRSLLVDTPTSNTTTSRSKSEGTPPRAPRRKASLTKVTKRSNMTEGLPRAPRRKDSVEHFDTTYCAAPIMNPTTTSR